MTNFFEHKPIYLTLRKPIFQNFNEIKNNAMNSIEEESTEEKRTEKDIKSNDFNNLFLKNQFVQKPCLDLSSKLNIIINNDDILQEQKLLNSKKFSLFSDNPQNEKKKIFLCNKRLHDEDNISPDFLDGIFESSKKNGEIKKYGTRKIKKVAYKKHDKMEKDNIVRKIQVHYCNFLISFINEIIQKIIIDESYKTENAEEIIHMKDYHFNNIDYKFKSNIKKDFMEKTENMKIMEIICPPKDFCAKYNIDNKNEDIMNKIEIKNNPIINKILNQKYLYYFNEIYYQNKRNLNISEENESIDIVLSNNTKMFNDLIFKNKDDKNYIIKLKRVVMQNFSKPKYMFKIKK